MLLISRIKFYSPDEAKSLTDIKRATHRYGIALRVNGLTFGRAFFTDKASAGNSYMAALKAMNKPSRQLSDRISLALYDRGVQDIIVTEMELPVDGFSMETEQNKVNGFIKYQI